jgi:hypothetical protein
MKSLLVCCAVLAAAAIAAAQTPKHGVKVESEKGVDYTKFKTYSWTQGQPSPDKTIEGQIVTAVDRELAGLGMTKATLGSGDVLVAYYSVTRTDGTREARRQRAPTRDLDWNPHGRAARTGEPQAPAAPARG